MPIVPTQLTGFAYGENFNTLAVSGSSNTALPPGWGFIESGSGGNTTYAAGDGTSSTGNTYSFGTGTATDRAFGEVTSTAVQSVLGAAFVNSTGRPLSSIIISYTGEQWRLGDSAAPADQLDFQYSTTATDLTIGTFRDFDTLDFIAPNNSAGSVGALNGNAAANRTVFSPTLIVVDIPVDATFTIRWIPRNIAGNNDGLAIDDFSLTAVAANTAPTDITLSGNSAAELAGTGTVVGTLSATDDSGTPAFTLLDDAGGRFQITGNQLKVADGLLLDYEQTASHLVSVRATDQGGLFSDKVFTINVTNVDPEVVTGLARPDTFYGGRLNDSLDGAAGADTLVGGQGNDVYFVDNASDVVTENANGGTDTVNASISCTLAANVENLTLLGSADLQGNGNSLLNTLTGNAGNNLLDGGVDADTMIGGAGDDVYFVDNIGDLTVENANGGNDTVFSAINFTLSANVENLILQGGADLQGYGDASNNVIYGNAGNNLLNGAGGADLMVGGAGNDTYFVDNSSDSAFESPGQGSDAVFATAHYGLAADVETLVLQGSADLQGYGNNQVNTIYGNAGNNLINGAGGADTMLGGAGNDTYFVDNAGDVVSENPNEGTDAVFSEVTFTLSGNLETLVLQGVGDVSGTGNALANSIFGNSGNNTLDGLGGADILTGNAGNDAFVFHFGQANGDTVVDFAGNGASAGDSLRFAGYGPGATFTNLDATHWRIDFAGMQEVITFSNGASVHPSDFAFV
jgi:Ca2+-binding RTX toxin-like protein